MADNVRHMLPPLHDAHRVPPLPKAGTWHSMGTANPLQVIARGLDTAKMESGGEIVSVPDVWAQLTAFANALETEGHPAHGQAVASWRGLLGCFALAAYRVPDLTSEMVSLRVANNAGTWASIAGRLPPRSSILDGRIEDVGLVRVGSVLVGLAQPLTLLAPSRSLPDFSDGRQPVPWMQHGHFRDPLLVAGLSGPEKSVLARFLAALVTDLEVERAAGCDVQALLGLAREYLADATRADPGASHDTFESVPASLALPASRVFGAFRNRERAVGARSDTRTSDCLLALRPELQGTQLKGVILLDLALHERVGKPAGDIVVWDRYSLRMLQDRPEDIPKATQDAQSAGYLVVKPEQLFLPKLFRVEGLPDLADAARGPSRNADNLAQHPEGARLHLLPLSPFVLAIVPPAHLRRSFRQSTSGAAGTTIDLRLTLADGKAVTLSRTYAEEEGCEPPFALSVWPDFQADWWRLHLAYLGATPDIQFVASGFVSVQGMIAALEASPDPHSAVAAARRLLGGDTVNLADTTWIRQDMQSAKALHMLPGTAEAVVMQDRRAGPGSRVTAGLLLFREPDTAREGAGGRTAKIGIDFGTTNTAVYIQIGAQEPVALQIRPRHILGYPTVQQSLEELDAELLPVTEVGVPFQTILRMRKLAENRGERTAFRDALVYFAQRRTTALGRLGEKEEDLFANLKWGNDEAARERVELFLTEVSVLALAEVAVLGVPPRSVTFHYSFPEAFREKQLASFQGAARNAVSRAVRMVAEPKQAPAPVLRFQTESVATAQYFINKLRTPSTEGLVTFDIGGQTTDVAIVQSQGRESDRLAWRGSFQLAGRHLLIEHLRESPAVIAQLARGHGPLDELRLKLAELKGASTEKRTLGTELLVNSREFMTAFDEVLPTLSGMPEADRLRAVAMTGLAGLFDYVGRTVRDLTEKGAIIARSGTPLSICLGGRASLLYRTLLHSEDEQAVALRFFTEATAGAMPLARLVFSESPKQEVAFGLVSDDGLLSGRVASEPLLGEGLRSSGKEVSAESLMSALDIDTAWRIEGADEFKRFVGKLSALQIRPANPADIFSQVVGAANAEIMAGLRTARAERSPGWPTSDTTAVEPPFIVLLRLLVHRFATDAGSLRS